jgi:Holliday junction DNA helicase RuvA
VFAFLRGSVADKTPGLVALDVNGTGYEVHVSARTYAKLALRQDVTLLTYCHIREDAFQIFGFPSKDERALFISLLSISKVGPKVALSVLSAFSVGEFGRAISESDLDAFKKVPGVGKATAQRLILEMKNQLKQDADLKALLGESSDVAAAPEGDDVYDALISLGCTAVEARNAATQARKTLGESARPEELVRAALQSLAKSAR